MTFTEFINKLELNTELLNHFNMDNKLKNTKIIDAQKNCANAVLSMLHMVDPRSCILGGAPRDWALGNPAKDLDVYVQGYPDEDLESIVLRISQALELQENEIEDVTNTSYYVHSLDNGVLNVLNIKNCYMPIQVIICDRNPIDMLDKFHGSLSKVSYRRSMMWHPLRRDDCFILETSMEFDISRQFNVHLVRASDDPRYIAKVQAKYPNFTAVYEK